MSAYVICRAWSRADRPGSLSREATAVAIQASYEWITPPRLRVLGQLAENRTEQETADRLGMKYNTVRGIVAHIKAQTGLSDVREIGRWWRAERRSGLWWAAKEAGLPLESGAA